MRTFVVIIGVYLVLAFLALAEQGLISLPVSIGVALPPNALDRFSWYLVDVVQGNASSLPLVGGFAILAVPAAFVYSKVQAWMDPTTASRGIIVRRARDHDRSQGRLSERELVKALRLPPDRDDLGPGIPLGYLKKTPLGLDWDIDLGHVAVIGPTRSGKSFHLTETLLRWPGPAVVVDPKGEQWMRTAGFRKEWRGPVYRIPPQGLDLARLYDLDDDLDRRELHETLLRPWRDGHDRIFADKALALLDAAVVASARTGEHPLVLLALLARQSASLALRDAALLAPEQVRTFTDGTKPEEIDRNRFAMSSWGTFSTRFSPFVAHLPTVTTPQIPADWVAQNATIYVTYPLPSLEAVGPLSAALVAGLMRWLLAHPPATRVLFALDEMPSVALPHLNSYLATVGGAGMTVVFYAQALPQIEAIYGREAALSILANCPHQVYFPPRDPQTAELASRAFGTRFEAIDTPSGTGVHVQTQYRPALEVGQLLALPAGKALIFSRDLRFVADDDRSIVSSWLPDVPPPPTVQGSPPRRPLDQPRSKPDDGRSTGAASADQPPAKSPARNEYRNRSDQQSDRNRRSPDDERHERFW